MLTRKHLVDDVRVFIDRAHLGINIVLVLGTGCTWTVFFIANFIEYRAWYTQLKC